MVHCTSVISKTGSVCLGEEEEEEEEKEEEEEEEDNNSNKKLSPHSQCDE